MIFESIVAITSAVSAINGLFEQVENGTKNVQTLLGQLGAISLALISMKLKDATLTAPLDGESAMRLAGQKARLERYHENLKLLSNMNSEAARVIDVYFEELEGSKRNKGIVRVLKKQLKSKKEDVNRCLKMLVSMEF